MDEKIIPLVGAPKCMTIHHDKYDNENRAIETTIDVHPGYVDHRNHMIGAISCTITRYTNRCTINLPSNKNPDYELMKDIVNAIFSNIAVRERIHAVENAILEKIKSENHCEGQDLLDRMHEYIDGVSPTEIKEMRDLPVVTEDYSTGVIVYKMTADIT